MDRLVYLNTLYDIYKDLLTEKQKDYFENYYFDNLSLSEIADNYGISRNAVHNQIKIIEEKLIELEEKLKINYKNERILEILNKNVDENIIEEIKGIL